MVQKRDFERVDKDIWELSKDFRADMRVPARLFSDAALFDAVLDDRSAEQLVDTATLPGIVGYAMAMPDFHQGYGLSHRWCGGDENRPWRYLARRGWVRHQL
jgi:tRNA-splicing ligase RtcB